MSDEIEYECDGYTFKQTCMACPEQYDVYDENGNQAAYVRLRWGYASCECPDVGGDEVYGMEVGDDGFAGMFEDNEQREEFFEDCVKAIDEWRESCDNDDENDW